MAEDEDADDIMYNHTNDSYNSDGEEEFGMLG